MESSKRTKTLLIISHFGLEEHSPQRRVSTICESVQDGKGAPKRIGAKMTKHQAASTMDLRRAMDTSAILAPS
jgi:hypothetical protein